MPYITYVVSFFQDAIRLSPEVAVEQTVQMPSSTNVDYTPLFEASTLRPTLSRRSSDKGSMVKINKPPEDNLVQDLKLQAGENSSEDGSP